MWLGHSAFSITAPSGFVILIDPWLDNPKGPAQAQEISRVDLILVTHAHSDHLGNTVELVRRTEAKVVCIHELSLYLKRQGLSRVVAMGKGGTVEVNGIAITMVDARHSAGIDVNEGAVEYGGEPAGFVMRFGKKRTVYHAGDTALFGDMKLIGKLYNPDIALLPIGGHYTMGPREAAMACDFLKPKKIIGMHYGTFPVLTGTPQQLRRYLHTRMKERLIELTPGDSLAF
jgi:L-ascorbate metabolism protein UlaG (beta-lactamase superfamily)